MAPIADAASKAYNINISTVNLSTSLFSFACLFTGIPANVLIIKFGLRKTKILANLVFVLGSALKLLVNRNIYYVHAGQLLAGLGAPFVQNSIAIFSEEWFEGEGVSELVLRLNVEGDLHLNNEPHESNRNYRLLHLPFLFC